MPTVRSLAALAAAVLFAACSDSPTQPAGPGDDDRFHEIQVDGSEVTAYVRLGETPQVVSIADPATSTDWDLSFFTTSVALNSGEHGPGSVRGYCLCANEGVSNAAIQTLTPANQLTAFLDVGAAQIPGDGQFLAESLAPRITGWYTGSGASAQADAGRAFIVLRSRVLPSPLYGKFRVTHITGATATSPGTVTFEYAMMAAPNGPLPETRSATVTVGAAPVYFDFAAGATSSASGTWDIRFEGFLIRVNSGVSGGAGHLVAPAQAAFESLDLAALRATPNAAFGQDALGGPFGAKPWYKYNVTGSDNQIWPNFNVYLVKKGDAVYKVQLTGYYDATGKARVVTVRSTRVS